MSKKQFRSKLEALRGEFTDDQEWKKSKKEMQNRFQNIEQMISNLQKTHINPLSKYKLNVIKNTNLMDDF